MGICRPPGEEARIFYPNFTCFIIIRVYNYTTV